MMFLNLYTLHLYQTLNFQHQTLGHIEAYHGYLIYALFEYLMGRDLLFCQFLKFENHQLQENVRSK